MYIIQYNILHTDISKPQFKHTLINCLYKDYTRVNTKYKQIKPNKHTNKQTNNQTKNNNTNIIGNVKE